MAMHQAMLHASITHNDDEPLKERQAFRKASLICSVEAQLACSGCTHYHRAQQIISLFMKECDLNILTN